MSSFNLYLFRHSTNIYASNLLPTQDIFSYCHEISHAKQYFISDALTVLAYLSISSGLNLKFYKYSLRRENVALFNFRRECRSPGSQITDDRQL